MSTPDIFEMRKTVFFLSGPMSGLPDYGHKAFFEAERLLREKYPDAAVLNPASLPIDLNPDNYMPIDLAMLREADICVMLDGWEKAEGAKLENAYARKLGKPIFMIWQYRDVEA